MKNLLIIIILLFTGSFIYSQSLEFSCWTDETESIVVPEVQDAINSNSTYNEIVIIAKDYGTSPQLPAWFDEIINGLPVFFSDGTFGNFIFNAEVLKADEIINKMIPHFAKQELAEFCDGFCEATAFAADEIDEIFTCADKHGLKLKLHTE